MLPADYPPYPNSFRLRAMTLSSFMPLPFIAPEPDLPLWRQLWRHELVDSVEHNLELGVVLLFESGEFPGEVVVGREHLAEFYECSHDGDVDLYGAWAAEDAGEHGDALFGKA